MPAPTHRTRLLKMTHAERDRDAKGLAGTEAHAARWLLLTHLFTRASSGESPQRGQ